MQYAIRIPANKSLELAIEDILFRPPGGPGRKPLVRYKSDELALASQGVDWNRRFLRSFRYQAESWSKPRRIVAKVEHHLGELFPCVVFVVTNMTLPSRSVVRFYNKRGTAEQWIKEGKQATHWTRLSCHRFRANEVPTATECAGLQPRQPVAATRAAAQDQELVADELAAAADEDGRSAGQACSLLLVAAGGEASEPAAVR